MGAGSKTGRGQEIWFGLIATLPINYTSSTRTAPIGSLGLLDQSIVPQRRDADFLRCFVKVVWEADPTREKREARAGMLGKAETFRESIRTSDTTPHPCSSIMWLLITSKSTLEFVDF